ncbi:Chitin synthase D [Penicillium oxalicum]|uniref:Chitin synthase D n=1 Tax=Penicillium oxalicum TaxID=69781 RepID=UPI0020B70DB0|nr:Chitin synthase D [Penicillium oxalicum]KAI2791278.1 Chitin synthase D [Penicillium oxalicum]
MADGEQKSLQGYLQIQDVIYLAVVGPLMLAAVFEWVLWLAAFLYCLVKVYVKADHWSIKVLAALMIVLFTLFRLAFLPVMAVTLPLPSSISRHIPSHMATIFQWFAFWTFSILLTGPWLFCVYGLVTNHMGRKKRIKQVLDDQTAPKTVVVMPVYKEDPETLIKAVNSVVESDYPASCIHVFLSWDGDAIDESYLRVIHHLGIPVSLKCYPQSIDVVYKAVRITVSRFKHGGKRHCQKQTFRLIDRVYVEYLKLHDDLFVLFIDSDCILDQYCLQNFMYDMELKPGSPRNMLAMTGIITSTTTKNSLITVLQDMEYIHGQLFERSVESGCGAVTCLPGALTILRFSAFRKMAKYYFADKAEQCDDLFDYGKCHLGEDRWLTHLFMIGAKKPYQIQMCTGAFCKTEAVQTFKSLLKQRRRWFLGFITNEACMLTDIRLWVRYPLLCIVRFMQNTIRTTALLFFIIAIALITTSKKVDDLPVGFIGVSVGLNYLLMFYFGLQLKRFKTWLYPIMFVINPFFNWLYMVYGIFTAGQRTWVKARAQGDELNVDVDTFRAGLVRQRPVPVRPSVKVEGRFAPAEQIHDGSYLHPRDHIPAIVQMDGSLPQIPRIHPPGHFHYSSESLVSGSSDYGSHTVSLPQHVDSLMSEEDRRKWYYAHQATGSLGLSILEDRSDSCLVDLAAQRPVRIVRAATEARPGLVQLGSSEPATVSRVVKKGVARVPA